MSKIKWELIFINNKDEINSYLESYDLKEMSQMSKSVRLKTKTRLLSNILIDDNIDNIVIKELCNSKQIFKYSISSFLDLPATAYIELFNICIQKLLPYINSINLKNYGNHYQLLEVSTLLPKLSKLTINNNIISFTAFKTALDNFENLEYLKIDSVNFVQYRNENYSLTPIKLPCSLKSILWQYCKVFLCELECDPQTINSDVYESMLYEHSAILFQPISLPNLKHLCSFSLPVQFYIDLMQNNTQLTSLDIKISSLNELSVALFNNIQNIKKMSLLIDRSEFDFNAVKWCFPNLTSLKFYGVDQEIWKLLEKLVRSCPNIEELRFNFHTDTSPPLIELINNTQSLKKLVVGSGKSLSFNFEDFKLHPRLNQLEFLLELDISPLLLKLIKFPNFKLLSFKRGYFSNTSSSIIHDQQSVPKPWKLIKTEQYYRYYLLS